MGLVEEAEMKGGCSGGPGAPHSPTGPGEPLNTLTQDSKLHLNGGSGLLNVAGGTRESGMAEARFLASVLRSDDPGWLKALLEQSQGWGAVMGVESWLTSSECVPVPLQPGHNSSWEQLWLHFGRGLTPAQENRLQTLACRV